jgi:hypothetical protein
VHSDREIVKKMQKATSLSMRIYTCGKTNTYEFNDLRDLRKVLSEEYTRVNKTNSFVFLVILLQKGLTNKAL